MQLNTLKPFQGSKQTSKRVGRGIGSGCGKTAGRGHKGQRSRAGGKVRIGFEGGQMPLQRRLPKLGFLSMRQAQSDEVRLSEISKLDTAVIDMAVLKQSGLVSCRVKRVKIIASGEITRSVQIKNDILVTRGAKVAIESVGGKVEIHE